MSNVRQKSVVLILDGLGDLPSDLLGGQTPLEAAHTPTLDRLAGAGFYGLVDPVGKGKIPNTHSGCGVLMGVLPADLKQLKRGPVEASGAGRVLGTDEIAVRGNFATLEAQRDRLNIIDRRAGRITEGTEKLAVGLEKVDLGDGISGALLPTDQHRCVVVFSGRGLDPRVGNTDPGDRALPACVKPCEPLALAAELTAAKVDRFLQIAREHLLGHPLNMEREAAGLLPANGIITRGAGRGFSLDNVLTSKGIEAAVVAGCNTVIGLARTLGFESITDSRFTADENTDIDAKFGAALTALERRDMVYVHIKAPDLFAHDHQPGLKKAFLERVDRSIGRLEQAGIVIALAADHSTDSLSGTHTADPVPALLFDPSTALGDREQPPNFGENACASGTMPRQSSHQFLLRLLGRVG